MERRPHLLALLLGFAFLAMVAGRETFVRRQALDQAQAVAAELQRFTADGAKLSAADLADLAQPLGFDRAELRFAKGAAWTWEAPRRQWPWFPRQSVVLPVSLWGGRAELSLARAPLQWWLDLVGVLLLLGLAWGLRQLQRAWEQERSIRETRPCRRRPASAAAWCGSYSGGWRPSRTWGACCGGLRGGRPQRHGPGLERRAGPVGRGRAGGLGRVVPLL